MADKKSSSSSDASKPNDSVAADPSDSKSDKKASGGSKQPTMHVRIASPFKTFYDDEAYSISGVNGSGPFDILPKHHNFISLLSEGELVVRHYREPIKVRISGGVMHVKSDQIVVFLNV